MPEAPAIHTEDDSVVIVSTGSMSATGSNPAQAHNAAMDFRTGLRKLTPDDIHNFDQIAAAKGLTTADERTAFFNNVWGNKCGVGGVIPDEYFPNLDSGFYPRTFFKKGELLVGVQVQQAYIVMDQIRRQLQQIFTDEGKLLPELAPETMIDIANGAGCAVEMIEREYGDLLSNPNTPKLGAEYSRSRWLLGMLGNMTAGQLASAIGIEGAQNSSNSACAGSGLSTYNGFNAIRAGNADIAIVGGSEYATGPVTTYASFDHMLKSRDGARGALTREWRKHRNPDQALMAYGALRDGFVPGDAAGLIVMMRRKLADKLGIQPSAEVLSVVANSCQPERYRGKSLTGGTITGQSALLERLLGKAGMTLSDIRGQLIHFLHGTGTIVGATNEVYASANVLGEIARDGRYVATGTKERDGHSLGAAFTMSTVAALEAMRNGIVPGLPTTTEVDPALRKCDPKHIGDEGIEVRSEDLDAIADGVLCRRHMKVEPDATWIVDAKGFGGTNAAMLMREVK